MDTAYPRQLRLEIALSLVFQSEKYEAYKTGNCMKTYNNN